MSTQISGKTAAVVIVGFTIIIVVAFRHNEPKRQQRAQEEIATEQRENVEAIKQHHALIGMTSAQVRQSWGEPKRIVRTMDDRHTYEEWIYGRNGSASLSFVDGVFKSGTRDDGK
jgi:hypothetical protein